MRFHIFNLKLLQHCVSENQLILKLWQNLLPPSPFQPKPIMEVCSSVLILLNALISGSQSNSLMPLRTIEIISLQSVESNSILKSKWNHSLCGWGWLNPPGVFGEDYSSQWMGPEKQSLLIPTWKRILIYSSFLKSVSKYKGPKSLLLMNL